MPSSRRTRLFVARAVSLAVYALAVAIVYVATLGGRDEPGDAPLQPDAMADSGPSSDDSISIARIQLEAPLRTARVPESGFLGVIDGVATLYDFGLHAGLGGTPSSGRAVLSAKRITGGVPAAFYRLPEVRVGDAIDLRWQGQAFAYRVVSACWLSSDMVANDLFTSTPSQTLTLLTGGGESRPPGRLTHELIVKAQPAASATPQACEVGVAETPSSESGCSPAFGSEAIGKVRLAFEAGVPAAEREAARAGARSAQAFVSAHLGDMPLACLDMQAEVKGSASGIAHRIVFYRGFGADVPTAIGHEYAHLWQQEAARGALSPGPRWLNEGSANLIGILGSGRKDDWRDSLRRAVVATSDLPALSTLEFGADGVLYNYVTLATDFLVSGKDVDALRPYYEAIGQRRPWREAFRDAFGLPADDFYRQFEAYKQAGFNSDIKLVLMEP